MTVKKRTFAGNRPAGRDRIEAASSRRLKRYLKRLNTRSGKGGRSLVVLIALWMLFVTFGQSAQAAVDAAAVQRAIDRGIGYLRKSQTARGGWNEYGSQSCGLSSLCTLALINAGVARDDPDLIRAMRYLRTFEPNETYSVALQTLVYCQLGAAGDLGPIRRNVTWLVREQKREAVRNRAGGWGYGQNRGSGDPSNTQFALLALGAAQDRGIEVDPEVFQRSLEYWTLRQRDGGGWSYSSQQGPTGSMTCAGIASVIIARGRLAEGSSKIIGERIECCGGGNGQDPVEAGLNWLGRNFSLAVNPGGDSMTYFYYLYALERVGRLSGRRFIGNHDWYREGAERLVEMQDDFQGFWSGVAPMESNRDITTSFALLFLSKGKRQVVIGRLRPTDQADDNDWRHHPDSLRQLVRHVERDWGRDLTWQTIEGQRASVVDLLQTPVLVISGTRGLALSDAQSDRLRQYIDQGGCILFEADAGDGCGEASAFEASVRRLCEQWFEGAKLDRLPPSHPIWFAERQADPKPLGDDFWVYGVQACCRTAVFYVPRSLSCRWELGDVLFHRGGESISVRKQIDTSVRLGQNLIAYATGRELKDKLEQRVILNATDTPEIGRGVLQIAMLALDAGGEEARRALPNAAAIIRDRVPIELAAARNPSGFTQKSLKDIALLWIHGRTDFRLDDRQRSVLREFLENGGTIFGTSICGSQAFGDAFKRELSGVLPDAPLRAMPGNHPAFTTTYGGFDVTAVTIRTPADRGSGQSINRRTSHPIIEVAAIDDIACVFFSPLDISCALESQNSVQCPGYSTDAAAKIVANLLLFSLQQ